MTACLRLEFVLPEDVQTAYYPFAFVGGFFSSGSRVRQVSKEPAKHIAGHLPPDFGCASGPEYGY